MILRKSETIQSPYDPRVKTHGDKNDGVIWKAAMHLTISRGYRKSALENSSSDAILGVSLGCPEGKIIQVVVIAYQGSHQRT